MPDVRFKIVPPVRDAEFLREAAETLPLVPGSVEDCCSRIRDSTSVTSRDEAREYLTFLQALGLVAETELGYHRVREAPDDEALADAFRERVFCAREVVGVLSDESRSAEAVFEAIREDVPRWERERYEDWEAEWGDRIERLLDWAAVFELVTEADGQYRAAQ